MQPELDVSKNTEWQKHIRQKWVWCISITAMISSGANYQNIKQYYNIFT